MKVFAFLAVVVLLACVEANGKLKTFSNKLHANNFSNSANILESITI